MVYTDTRLNRLLKKAINDLLRMLPETRKHYPAILDTGCGRDHSLQLLDEYFRPDKIKSGQDRRSSTYAVWVNSVQR